MRVVAPLRYSHGATRLEDERHKSSAASAATRAGAARCHNEWTPAPARGVGDEAVERRDRAVGINRRSHTIANASRMNSSAAHSSRTIRPSAVRSY